MRIRLFNDARIIPGANSWLVRWSETTILSMDFISCANSRLITLALGSSGTPDQ
jgi:hypothetical protein